MRPALKCGHRVFNGCVCRDHDEEGVGAELEGAIEDGDSIGTRELDIAEDDLGLEGLDLL
jgi:hypothetical protein